MSARIRALLTVLKGQADIELLALDSSESFDSNKAFYRSRLENEPLPAIRELLDRDSAHLDRIQALLVSAREFCIAVRFRGTKETEMLTRLAQLEKTIRDSGFLARRAGEQDIKRLLAVCFEQNVTTTHFADYDGELYAWEGCAI